jgi:hypothetical protein
MTFHIDHEEVPLDLEELKVQLPSTVIVTVDEFSYRITGSDPTMSRDDIARAFIGLCSKRKWQSRFFE